MKVTLLLAPELPFQYIGGDPALDLVNTVDWTSRGPEQDRLTDFGRLTRWAEGAGILLPKAASSLRAQAQARPREAQAAYHAALELRAVLARLFRAMAANEPAGDALDDFNRVLGRALERMRVTQAAGKRPAHQTLMLGWAGQEESLESVLWPVIWSAASLIVSEEASRIRICGGADCGWMYVDRSRNKLRRWCQMETCGTREKSRRRYERVRKGSPDVSAVSQSTAPAQPRL
jgi:predicted RNA-binding Zn ribbon-like protein